MRRLQHLGFLLPWKMLKLVVDGNWLCCAIIAASQLIGGCFRLHHEVSRFDYLCSCLKTGKPGTFSPGFRGGGSPVRLVILQRNRRSSRINIRMLSGILCLFALRRYRVSIVRKLLVPVVVLSLFYEFSQIHNAIRCEHCDLKMRRFFINPQKL